MYRFAYLLLMLFTLTRNEVVINVYRPGFNRTIHLFNGKNYTINGKNQTYDTYLIGGIDAKDKQFPYQVSLLQKSSDEFFCGGSIITTKHIISAAHCFCPGEHFKPAYDITVGAGDLTFNGPDTKTFDVLRTICHPKYDDKTKYHDISMLAIKKEFVFSDKISNIRLLVGGYSAIGEVVPNLSVFITGWGSDRYINPEPMSRLQYITTLTISLAKCREMLSNTSMGKFVKEWNVCTFHPDHQRTCVGDSGGPVVHQNQLLAVVSWSKRCDDNTPGIHTNIAHHNAWIQAECAKDKYMMWLQRYWHH